MFPMGQMTFTLLDDRALVRVGGEDARQMLARFETDVLPYKPQLVIWQVGSNYTLRSTDLEAYAAILRKGIDRLRSAHTDVILMDQGDGTRVRWSARMRPLVPGTGWLVKSNITRTLERALAGLKSRAENR